jgi:fatty acid desaturase
MCEQRLTKTRHRTSGNKRMPVRRGVTFWTFFPVYAAVTGVFACYAVGIASWWVNWALATPLTCYVLICAHDALHGSAHSNPRMNRLVGWLGTSLFVIPFSVVRRAHLSHHARTAKPDDIERFAYKLGWTLPLRWVFGNLCYYAALPKCKRAERIIARGMLVATACLLLMWPRVILVGWILPMQTTVLIFMVNTIYLPHGHFAAWINENIPFLTGYHEDHHAMTSYPWHQISQRKDRISRHRARVSQAL